MLTKKVVPGDTVFAIGNTWRVGSERQTVAYPRIVESVDEDGCWFRSKPEFVDNEFLFHTEDDALLYINAEAAAYQATI